MAQRASSDVNLFSHDISIMPLSLLRNVGHHRDHSEAFCHKNDEELISMYFDIEKFSSDSPTSEKSHEKLILVSEERPRFGHQCSQSLDGSDYIKPQFMVSSSRGLSAADRRQAKSAATLAEVALVDPQRARSVCIAISAFVQCDRMFANRQSAVRSKERKMHYMSELEQNVPKLQIKFNIIISSVDPLTDLSNLLGEQVWQLKMTILKGGQMENAGSSSFNSNQLVFHPD